MLSNSSLFAVSPYKLLYQVEDLSDQYKEAIDIL